MPVKHSYFSSRVKVNVDEFYDREKELDTIENALNTTPLIIIYGQRRMGKTSLLNVALNESDAPFIIIDARELYKKKSLIYETDILNLLLNEFRRKASRTKKFKLLLSGIASRIKGISFHGLEINLDPKNPPKLSDLLYEINSYAEKKEERFVIAIDEAQYLRFSNTRFDVLFASFVDRFKNITIILTGSEVGVLERFLDLDNPEKPLFGRIAVQLFLEGFDREKSSNFLIKGFEQFDAVPTGSELENAADTLGGNPGWLTMYGFYRCVLKHNPNYAKSKVINDASRLMMTELEHVIERSRERYLAILFSISQGINHWIDIKNYLIVSTGKNIDDKTFTKLLNKLLDYGFIFKKENVYGLTDPLMRHAILALREH
ncbi:MAG: ATP-binding protein [Thermoplasmatales archaeon]|nr:ATP-binding protein [Thermoplasmatales archaeon]MCW6170578.1 ATP-binding protein [Thermoplasmatales archaeon]